MGKGFDKESAVVVMSSTPPLQSSSPPSTPPKTTGAMRGTDQGQMVWSYIVLPLLLA